MWPWLIHASYLISSLNRWLLVQQQSRGGRKRRNNYFPFFFPFPHASITTNLFLISFPLLQPHTSIFCIQSCPLHAQMRTERRAMEKVGRKRKKINNDKCLSFYLFENLYHQSQLKYWVKIWPSDLNPN